MTIDKIQQEIVEEFSMFDDWMDKYAYLIELGGELEEIDPKYKTDQHVIKGCQSKVWFHPEFKDGVITFVAESDALIVKGLVALLLKVYSGQTPLDIINTEPNFIKEIGLGEHLSPTRANGLVAMIKQIKLYAIAYNKVQNS